MVKFVFDRVENIVGKGENTGCQQFLLFPQCFQKLSFFSVVKSWDCVVKVNPLPRMATFDTPQENAV